MQSKWYNIGIQLGLTVGILDAIRHDHHDQSVDCLREMLIAWLKHDFDATWERLIEALRTSVVAEMKLSHVLEAKYCSENAARTGT